MELIFVGALAIIALAIVTPIIAFKANEKANRLEQQLRQLYREVDQLKSQIKVPKQEVVQETVPESIVTNEPQPEPQPAFDSTPEENQPSVVTTKVEIAPAQPKHEPNAIHQWFDKCFDHMRDNWLVWVGGLAMVIGAGYLVQVVGSNFTFPPLARVMAAAAISLCLVAIGEWTHRKISAISTSFINDKADAYIPAALYASGMSGFYATVIFSTVVYQFFSPTIALIAMASLALLCLALTARLGPLMTALGLFGGYTAPFWIGGSEPNYLLLSSYILTITLAGLLTKFRNRIEWLASAISVAHGLWLLLIATSIPSEQIISWFLLFIPISSYLLIFTPVMGWKLDLRFKPHARWPFFHPLIPSVLLAGITALVIERSLTLSSGYLMTFVFPALILLIPAFRRRLTQRVFYGVTLVAIVQMIAAAVVIANETLTGEVWLVFAVLILIASGRVYSQYLLGDKSKIAYWMATLTLPTLLTTTLIYLNFEFIPYLDSWAIFSFTALALTLFAANRLQYLVRESAIAVHVLVLVLSYCYLDVELLPLAITLQTLVACWQQKAQLCSIGTTAIKAIMTLLIVKMSLIPFIPQLQITLLPEWLWALTSFVPAIIILVIARQLINSIDRTFKEWFDAAILHLAVLVTFTQTNYWLLDSYNFLAEISFYSVALFSCQALALYGVYQAKLRITTKLKSFYHYYSMTLLGLASVLILVLNTVYQPLLNTYVTGQDWPLVNWLAIGWVIPATILIALTHKGLFSSPIKALHLYSVAAGILGVWVIYSIRQFWQEGDITLNQPTGMAEMFSYSIAIIVAGAVTTYMGVKLHKAIIQKVGLVMLGVAVCKVFLLDTAALEGIWRAISFLGLGGSLIALGWLFQRLHYRSQRTKAESNETVNSVE